MKALLYLSLTLATCRLYAQNQDTLILRHLPPDADAIFRFNLPVITSKLGWQEWADLIPLPQQNTCARELAAILKEPFRAGIASDKDIFWTEITAPGTRTAAVVSGSPVSPGISPGSPATAVSPGTLPTDTFHTCSLLLHLADSGRFAAFLRTLEPGIHINSQDGKCSAGRTGMAAAWDRSLLVISFTTPLHPTQSHSHHTTLALRQSQTMLRGYADTDRILDPLFLLGFTDESDIDAWTAPGKISSLLLQYLLRPDNAIKYLQLIPPGGEKIHVLSTLRFEKGQVTIKSITPLPSGAANAWARLTAHPPATDPAPSTKNPISPILDSAALVPAYITTPIPVPPDHSAPLPGSTVPSNGLFLALLNLHINPGVIGDLLDSLHARGRTEELLFDKGLSLENFVHAFQGDLLLAVTAPDSNRSDGTTRAILTSSAPHNTHDHRAVYAAIPLEDLTAFWQWMGRLKWLTASPDQQDCGHGNASTTIGRHIPAYLVKKNCLIIAPDRQHALDWYNDTTWRKALTEATLALPDRSAVTKNFVGPASPRPTSFVPFASLGYIGRPCVLSLRIDLKNMAVIGGHTLDQLLFTAGRLNTSNQIENVLQLTLADSSRNSLPILFRILE